MINEESQLPMATRRLFSARNTLVLLVVTGTLLLLFAIQLDIPSTWHSSWSSHTSTDTSTITAAFNEAEAHFNPQYDSANQLITIPKIEDIKDKPDNYKWYTEAKLRWLTACLARGDCPRNADKVRISRLCLSNLGARRASRK
jgi:hypothetical protein